jgi:CheY-like chemotaxis protein
MPTPTSSESAILNLAVNARDAMPDGGWLTIETANLTIPEPAAAPPGLPAGDHVVVTVTDTGGGMTPDVLSRAFDPFFTTKPVGRGTGLGLSQVYGFVRQSGGQVRLESAPGQGTAVRVYLPRLLGAEAEAPREEPVRALPRGEAQEVVLVVEDEAVVRQFTVAALEDLGYRVLEPMGRGGAAAARRASRGRAAFTDIVMPETNGRKLAEEALRRRPGLPVLLTTGYARDAVAEGGVLAPGTQLIGKPFTVQALAAKLREVLDRPA